MSRRTLIIYAVLGPVSGALTYLVLSALAASRDFRPDIFLDPRLFGTTLLENLGLAGWQVVCSTPLTLLPALLTGWFTQRYAMVHGWCPWWASCGFGALASGALGIAGLGLGHILVGDAAPIPPIAGGSALIALIGFVGTVPCWLLAGRKAAS